MTINQLRSRILAQLILLCIAVASVIVSTQVNAATYVKLCNSTPHVLYVAETYNYYHDGKRYWKEHGSWNIEKGKCQRIPRAILVDQTSGYAFAAFIDGKMKNIVFSLNDVFRKNRAIESGFMCAKITEEFGYAPRNGNEVGVNCPKDAQPIQFSFWRLEPPRFTTKDYIENYHLRDFQIVKVLADATKSSSTSQSKSDQAACGSMSDQACFLEAQDLMMFGKGDDLTRALSLHSDSCARGTHKSCWLAGQLHYEGKGGPVNFEKAMHFFQKVCASNYAAGCYRAGELFEEGEGVTQDLSQAKTLYQKACKEGLAPACEKVK